MKAGPGLSIGAGAALLALPFLTGNTYLHHLMVLWMLYALLAMSLNIVIGYLGELNFGHAAFFGIGAYTTAILATRFGVPAILGLIAAAVAAGSFGLLIGYVALRIRGPQFAILTLGFGSILYTIANYWIDLTRGPMGISNLPLFSLAPGWMVLESARGSYLLVTTCVLACAYACHALTRSSTGRAFIAVRENERLAASIGIDVFRTKLLGFVVATALAGVGGALYAHYIRVVTPELLGVQYMVAMIIIVVVGGRGTIVGPILGAFIYVALLEALRAFGPLRMVTFSVLLTASVIFLPAGLAGTAARLLRPSRAAGGS